MGGAQPPTIKEMVFIIELYERYRLKDGRTGRSVDILGNGEACIFEVDKQGIEDRVITVIKDEISEKIS